LVPYDFSDSESKERFCFAFMKFTGLNESRLRKMQSILRESNSHNWEEHITIWVSKTLNIELEIIQRLWKTVKISLTMSYRYERQLPYHAKLVKARGAYGFGTMGMEHWPECFEEIEWLDSEGDHFTVIKEPHCSDWLCKLEESNRIIQESLNK
jgi:polyketide synthase PksL